ncbi:MAG: hypothetical protein Q7S72_00195 [Candidatus Taylorbacteria bacterium]|nr:hypothetical protein [Candidatus Taylorbacteria bacterium]
MNDNNKEKFYKSIGKVYCPYFNESVNFTDLGFEHLRFKIKQTARTHKDQIVRFKLLPFAIQVLNLSHTLQGINSRNRFEERIINSRREFALTLVTYYEFIAIIDGKKIKIVIKEIKGKERIFLSIIPLFKQKSPSEEDDGFSEHLATAECRAGVTPPNA